MSLLKKRKATPYAGKPITYNVKMSKYNLLRITVKVCLINCTDEKTKLSLREAKSKVFIF